MEVGEFVKAGTILSRLRMESTDLEIAEHEAMLAERQAELEEIRAPRKEDRDEAAARKQSADVSYATAERRLKELRALSQRGAANPTEVKDAEEALDAAEQNRLAAAAVLARISTPRPEAVQQAEARMMAQQKHVEFLKAEREKRLTKSRLMASSLKNTHTLDNGFPKEPPLQPLRSWTKWKSKSKSISSISIRLFPAARSLCEFREPVHATASHATGQAKWPPLCRERTGRKAHEAFRSSFACRMSSTHQRLRRLRRFEKA